MFLGAQSFKKYQWYGTTKFYILMTVYLCIILINNQLDAQFLLYIFISILYMFRATCAHHQESQLYQYNIWYMSFCVGGRPVCRSGPTRPV